MIRRLAVAAALFFLASATVLARPLDVTAEPFDIAAETLAEMRLSFVSAYRLNSPDPEFGGLSGLALDGDRLIAVSDAAHWVVLGVDRDGSGRITGLRGEEIAPILGPDGRSLTKKTGDAESLAVPRDGLLVGFENRHRIGGYDGPGGVERAFAPQPSFNVVRGNRGYEAVAVAPDGAVIAIAERATRKDRAQSVRDNLGFRLANGPAQRFRLTRSEGFAPTGADFGPEGALFLLERRFTLLGGVWMRIRRFAAPDFASGDLGAGEALAVLGPMTGIDNMEGIVVEASPDGSLLTLVSDDNFNTFQSTVLLQFRLRGD